MKKFIATFSFLHILTFSFGQNTDVKLLVDSLQYLKSGTLDCNATLYWKIISNGEKAIPFLIDKLSDTTQTNVSQSCETTKLNVGEIAYFALQQIAFFPPFVITHTQFDVIYGNGCWSFSIIYLITQTKKIIKIWFGSGTGQIRQNLKHKKFQRKGKLRVKRNFTLKLT